MPLKGRRGEHMFKKTILASLFIAAASSGVFADTYNVSTTLSLEEQKTLAQQLYQRMAELDSKEYEEIATLHTQVIEKCPDSLRAQKSCWQLSNLFILKQQNHQAAIDVLEHLLTRYPDTELKEIATNRLISCYGETGDYAKLCKLYEEMFDKDIKPSDKYYKARALDYAKALDAMGKSEDAKKWYREVINNDKNGNSLEARAARRLLGE